MKGYKGTGKVDDESPLIYAPYPDNQDEPENKDMKDKVKWIEDKPSKLKLLLNSIIGLLIVLLILWSVITGTVYSFINHEQTETERFVNLWYAWTCQWDRSFWNE